MLIYAHDTHVSNSRFQKTDIIGLVTGMDDILSGMRDGKNELLEKISDRPSRSFFLLQRRMVS